MTLWYTVKFMMGFDNARELRPHQERIFVLLCLPNVFVALADVNNAFLLYTPEHRCRDTKGNNYTFQKGNPIPTSRPLTECFIRKTNTSGNENDSTVEQCSSWEYDNSVFTSTFVSEHDLVCKYSGVPTYIQMVSYSGAFVGALAQGVFSDRFGRKFVMYVSLALATTTGLASAWSPNVYVYATLKFVNILATRGVYINSFVLVVELIVPSKRELAGFLFYYFYSGGIVLLAGIGYVLRRWDYIQIACSAPMLLFFVYFRAIPESPRWLICRGKMTGDKFQIKLAEVNDTDRYSPASVDTNENKSVTNVKNCFSSRTFVLGSLIIFLNYFSVFNCYYGLTLNSENLSGDFYLNFLLNGLVEFPAITIAIFSGKRLKHKTLYISAMSVAGLSLIGSAVTIILIKKDFITAIILTMIGKTGITIAMCMIFLWSAELIPTTIRSSVLGISIACGNAGSVMAPYMASLSRSFSETIGPAVPLFVFGSLTLGTAFLTLLLPETQNKELPETVSHAQEMAGLKEKTDIKLLT